MAKRVYRLEEIVNPLRQIEVAVANGKTTEQAAREADIVSRRTTVAKGVSRPKVDQARALKELEREKRPHTPHACGSSAD
jgi:hypothetical protein